VTTRPPDPGPDLVHELRFALAEGDALDAPDGLRDRVLTVATAARRPGRSTEATESIPGLEAFRRVVARFDALLTGLHEREWSRPSIRGLNVQGLVGHLVGVEEAFVTVLGGGPDPAVDLGHVSSTQPAADRQAGRAAQATHREWADRAAASLAAAAGLDPAQPVSFYGTTLPIDELLDIRAFELWIHDEDIRRATGRSLADPDPGTLARMVRRAVALLPAGIALAGRTRPGATARLVLTGPGGGTWDVNLDGTVDGRPADARVVVDAARFCRVVGAREDGASAGAVVAGAIEVIDDLLVGATALALD
jgi:uncharacterized protein (TIGR03083 family)